MGKWRVRTKKEQFVSNNIQINCSKNMTLTCWFVVFGRMFGIPMCNTRQHHKWYYIFPIANCESHAFCLDATVVCCMVLCNASGVWIISSFAILFQQLVCCFIPSPVRDFIYDYWYDATHFTTAWKLTAKTANKKIRPINYSLTELFTFFALIQFLITIFFCFWFGFGFASPSSIWTSQLQAENVSNFDCNISHCSATYSLPFKECQCIAFSIIHSVFFWCAKYKCVIYKKCAAKKKAHVVIA